MRVLVTGSRGFLAKHVLRVLRSCGHDVIADETRWGGGEPQDFGGIDAVVHLAARCGGILANLLNGAEYLAENIAINNHVLRCCAEAKCKLVVLSSVCGYPKFTPLPFHEDSMWDGYPEETNAPYGLAKRMLLEQCSAYRRQYAMDIVALVPTNLYGPGDHLIRERSHVVPALVQRFVDAERHGEDMVTLWGSGRPTRDLLYVEDCAEAIERALHVSTPKPINLGTGNEISICDLAVLVAEIVGYNGRIAWDTSKPDGQPRRVLDVSRAKELLQWTARTPLREGLVRTVGWYRSL